MENIVFDEVVNLIKDKSLEVSRDTPLIGDSSVLDSLGLVELCLALEDKAADLGFEFDWTSESAMSTSKGMFRSIGSLEEEFLRQWKRKE